MSEPWVRQDQQRLVHRRYRSAPAAVGRPRLLPAGRAGGGERILRGCWWSSVATLVDLFARSLYDIGGGFPVLSAGPTPRTAWRIGTSRSPARSTSPSGCVAGVPGSAARRGHRRHPLRPSGQRSRRRGAASPSRPSLIASRHRRTVCWPSAMVVTPRTSRLRSVTGDRAWIVDQYEGEPLEAEHGGPARLLVPHLYCW